MSYNEESPGVGDEATSRQAFEIALRGYDKRQVDSYLSQVDNEIATLGADRARAIDEIKHLSAQLQQLQAELADVRERPAQIDKATFRDLGPMVDQMLALAEKQAGTIVGTATRRAEHREAEAEKILNEAREHAAQTLVGLEGQLAARRTAADKLHEDRQAAADAKLAEARELAERVRGEGEAAREQAELEAHRITEENAQQVAQARAENDALLQEARTQTEEELAQQRANLEREIGERRTEAAQKIAALHTQAQQQADELRQRMNEQASAHQKQLAILQEEIDAQRQTLAELQSELDAADARLAQSSQQRAAMDHEVAQLQGRINEVGQALAAEHNRLGEAKRAGDAAEQYAKDVRAKVRSEAKRVAELAAAAVLAAAGDGNDTGEFPKVPVRQPAERATQPHVANHAPGQPAPATYAGHANDNQHAVPPQRGPVPVAADAE